MGIKSITLVGIALILLGIVAFAYQGISYTSREKIIDVGPLQASVDTKKTIPLSPLLGGLGACRRDRVGRGWNQEIVLGRLRRSLTTGNVVAKMTVHQFLISWEYR